VLACVFQVLRAENLKKQIESKIEANENQNPKQNEKQNLSNLNGHKYLKINRLGELRNKQKKSKIESNFIAK